ncbi:MAG: hypothetical protein KDC13_01305 [Bacteroidetes bacterium]|nr:hypothetical protein [Bacteroidota bacterium]
MQFRSSIVLLLFLFTAPACRPKATCGDIQFNSAESYVEFVELQKSRIDSAMRKLDQAFEKGSDQNIKIRYNQLVSTCDSVLLQTRDLSPFVQDSILKNSSWKLFSFYNEIFHNEYRELLEIYFAESIPDYIARQHAQSIMKQVSHDEDSLRMIFQESVKTFVHRNAAD